MTEASEEHQQHQEKELEIEVVMEMEGLFALQMEIEMWIEALNSMPKTFSALKLQMAHES